MLQSCARSIITSRGCHTLMSSSFKKNRAPSINQDGSRKLFVFFLPYSMASTETNAYLQKCLCFLEGITRWKSKGPSNWSSKAVLGHWAPCYVNRSPKSMRQLGCHGWNMRNWQSIKCGFPGKRMETWWHWPCSYHVLLSVFHPYQENLPTCS